MDGCFQRKYIERFLSSANDQSDETWGCCGLRASGLSDEQQEGIYDFDLAIRSTYLFTKDTILSPLLKQTERLGKNQVAMTYKQMAELPGFIYRMTGIEQKNQQLLPEFA